MTAYIKNEGMLPIVPVTAETDIRSGLTRNGRKDNKQKKKKKKRNNGVFSFTYRKSNEFTIIPGYGTFTAPYVTGEKRGEYGLNGEHRAASQLFSDPAARKNILR